LYKAEVIHRKSSWRTREEVEWATLTWVDWFNNRRLLEPPRLSRRLLGLSHADMADSLGCLDLE
ncbi:IS3 family transposase, partial [Xanthomonas melonis]|uniref:IS3 family transposase n=1 Tax=Xanthomonas melonis TaxID=56456 RepID=UPI001E55BD2C